MVFGEKWFISNGIYSRIFPHPFFFLDGVESSVIVTVWRMFIARVNKNYVVVRAETITFLCISKAGQMDMANIYVLCSTLCTLLVISIFLITNQIAERLIKNWPPSVHSAHAETGHLTESNRTEQIRSDSLSTEEQRSSSVVCQVWNWTAAGNVRAFLYCLDYNRMVIYNMLTTRRVRIEYHHSSLSDCSS